MTSDPDAQKRRWNGLFPHTHHLSQAEPGLVCSWLDWSNTMLGTDPEVGVVYTARPHLLREFDSGAI